VAVLIPDVEAVLNIVPAVLSFPCVLYRCIVSFLICSNINFREKEEVGRLKQSHNEADFFTVLPQEFKTMLTHIKSLTYFDRPDYELIANLFAQSMERLGEL